jgi:type II secretory pathway predicted ATPase ExeA
MYESHFGLRQRPFPATPDPGCYYPATSHERALARLLQGLSDGEGLLLLTGAPGTGKTLVCHCLLERLGSGLSSAFLTNSRIRDRAGLLQAILFDLSLPYEGRSEQEMRLALTDHLLSTFAAGTHTVLVVDEAHHLGPDLLEELRLLGNLEARTGKALQVVLVGQPVLLEILCRPELASLRQRLAVRAELEPLAVQEAADYLLHHLRVAGGRPERILADEGLELLARSTQGVPRLLNQAAHQALALAGEAGTAEVDAEAVLEALALLGLDGEAETEEPASWVGPGLVEPAPTPTPSEEPAVNGGALDAVLPPEEGATEGGENASCRLLFSSASSD